jgi:hypothetical protein
MKGNGCLEVSCRNERRIRAFTRYPLNQEVPS